MSLSPTEQAAQPRRFRQTRLLTQISHSGSPRPPPFSHLLTALLLTQRRSASSVWVMPSFFLRRDRVFPNLVVFMLCSPSTAVPQKLQTVSRVCIIFFKHTHFCYRFAKYNTHPLDSEITCVYLFGQPHKAPLHLTLFLPVLTDLIIHLNTIKSKPILNRKSSKKRGRCPQFVDTSSKIITK